MLDGGSINRQQHANPLRTLAEEFSALRKAAGLRNELYLRRLEKERLLDVASQMYRFIETAVAQLNAQDTVELNGMIPSPVVVSRHERRRSSGSQKTDLMSPRSDKSRGNLDDQHSGNLSPARSDIDPRVRNGSWVGNKSAAFDDVTSPQMSPRPDMSPGVVPLTRTAMKNFESVMPPAQSLVPGLRVGGSDSMSTGHNSDVSGAPTKFSQSHVTEDNDGIFEGVNDYLLLEEIGRGATGRVMKACHMETNKTYAVKIVPRELVVDERRTTKLQSSNADAEVVFRKEVCVMKALKHKSIVRLLEVIDDPAEKQVYLVMPLLADPILKFDDRRECERLEPEKASTYIRQVIAGLQYLRRHRIVHRDLKPDNIVLSQEGRAVLVDFGQSEWGQRKEDEEEGLGEQEMSHSDRTSHSGSSSGGGWRGKQTRNLGTPAFTAPEVINGTSADYPQDVWSLGVIIYSMMYGRLPFVGGPGARGRQELYDRILNDEPHYDDNDVSYLWNLMIQQCLMKNPKERIALGDLKRHPAMSSVAMSVGSRSTSSAASEMEFSMMSPTTDGLSLEDVLMPVRHMKGVANTTGGFLSTDPKPPAPLMDARVQGSPTTMRDRSDSLGGDRRIPPPPGGMPRPAHANGNNSAASNSLQNTMLAESPSGVLSPDVNASDGLVLKSPIFREVRSGEEKLRYRLSASPAGTTTPSASPIRLTRVQQIRSQTAAASASPKD
jgi:serine/threonine protein kinase